CMVMVANLQYGWTLFVGPIGTKYGWTKAAIQVTFTIFVLFETWLVPAEGYLVDRFGPKWMIVVGGLLCGLAWTINSFADSLGMFYFAAVLRGFYQTIGARGGRVCVAPAPRVGLDKTDWEELGESLGAGTAASHRRNPHMGV